MCTAAQIPELSVTEVALKYPHALEVFNKYHIDYCCGGQLSFQSACEKSGVASNLVWEQIVKGDTTEGLSNNFKKWSPALLVDYIIDQYHGYIKASIPLLKELLKKVSEEHSREHPELHEVRAQFILLSEELSQHLLKEERILFPAIKKREATSQTIALDQPIAVMREEHEMAGDLLREIRRLTSNYMLPNDVCTTYRMTYNKLEAFDMDLMRHIHLENNILFEKVRQQVS